MDEWIDGCMGVWVDGWLVGWTGEWATSSIRSTSCTTRSSSSLESRSPSSIRRRSSRTCACSTYSTSNLTSYQTQEHTTHSDGHSGQNIYVFKLGRSPTDVQNLILLAGQCCLQDMDLPSTSEHVCHMWARTEGSSSAQHHLADGSTLSLEHVSMGRELELLRVVQKGSRAFACRRGEVNRFNEHKPTVDQLKLE